ncbi:Thymidylate kinase [Ferriphaselus amnicola]|uniref:Thymidylate kinase n=1 Tax=Ferriphaselus amnicola TaxID=1188319 RepID=A0A2Z6GD63_9PROT|nr:dTMP kinase [Ferriphaselus amnicola]BBE51314.1 Thymidylate kinase [Ferriphaselus amnicola]
MSNKGRFITFEGVDGAGKSTHLAWFVEALRQRGIEVVLTREPGGTPLGEQLRELVLHQPMHMDTEAMLMFAGRVEHIEQVIKPALERGAWVVSDRFSDASFAYQGGGRGMDITRLSALEDWACRGFQPELTLLFDLPVEVAKLRLADAREPDKFEREQSGFFQRVRDAYLQRARQQPQRFAIIDAAQSQEQVRAQLKAVFDQL